MITASRAINQHIFTHVLSSPPLFCGWRLFSDCLSLFHSTHSLVALLHTLGAGKQDCASLMSFDLRLPVTWHQAETPTRYLQSSVRWPLHWWNSRHIFLLAWMLAEAVEVLLWVQRFPSLISDRGSKHPLRGLICVCCSGSHFQKPSLSRLLWPLNIMYSICLC